MAIKAKILKIFGIIWIGCASIPIIFNLPHMMKSMWENGFFDTSWIGPVFVMSPGFYAFWWKDQLLNQEADSSLKTEMKRAAILAILVVGVISLIIVIILYARNESSGAIAKRVPEKSESALVHAAIAEQNSQELLKLITYSSWYKMSEPEKDSYIKGVLEDRSFDYSLTNNSQQKAFVACVTKEGIPEIKRMTEWAMNLGDADKPAPWWVSSAVSTVCAPYQEQAKKDIIEKSVGVVHIFSVAEFLQLPESAQAVYVGGLIEGISFASYAYDSEKDEYANWVHCVSSQAVGDTTKDVVTFIQQEKGFDGGVSLALAKTIGKRCKHKSQSDANNKGTDN